jgi:Na+/glutamate symporter
MYVMQGFVGYPLTALALKKEANRLVDLFRQGTVEVKSAADQGDAGGKSMLQIFPPTPEEYQTTFVMLAKIALLALLSVKLAELTGNALSPYVVCLLVGVIGAETGFIERRPLNIANSFGWLMLTLMAYVMAGLSSATPEMLMEILFPLAGSLIIGVIGMAILSMLVSRLVGYTKEIGFATALTALYGFPPNYILTMEAIKAVAENQEEREFLTNEMLPKMLVGGFTTVTIVSVILAGIFVGYM